PTTGIFHLDLPSTCSIKIFDAYGKLVLIKSMTSAQVDASQLMNGYYTVQAIDQEGHIHRGRIYIQK
ncbi:MAG: T9SS type A sorting domain-containing protein, partial [Bacteroidota bacterium]|nr:T9SS type A sorting domain-containing protein [Bacteroidota bacterium]